MDYSWLQIEINVFCVYRLIQVVLQKIGMEVELGFVLAVLRLFSGKKRMKTEVCVVQD